MFEFDVFQIPSRMADIMLKLKIDPNLVGFSFGCKSPCNIHSYTITMNTIFDNVQIIFDNRIGIFNNLVSMFNIHSCTIAMNTIIDNVQTIFGNEIRDLE